MALVETHCKICNTASTDDPPFQASENTLQYHSEAYKFTKVYPKNFCVGDIGLACFGENRAWNFFNSFNNALFICGTKSLLHTFLFPKSSRKHDNFLITLYDQFLTQWNKKCKAKKRLMTSLRNSQTLNSDELKLHIYVQNTKHGNIANSVLQESHSISELHSEMIEPSVSKTFTSMSATEYLSLLHNNITFSDNIDESNVLVIDFELTWYTLDYVNPMTSWFHIIFLPFKSDSTWTSIYKPMFSDSPNCFATYFGESCHTKLLYLVDGKDGVETANLLNHSILFKELKNYPIKNTPFVETLLNMYKKEVATLTSENVRLKNTLKKTIDEHSEKNESLQQENNELKVQTEYLQDELKQVKTEYMKLIELQKSFTENDIKDRKQLAEIENQAVSSKLHSNELKIEMEDHQHKSKEKIAALEEKLLKLQRLLLYERKLNEDMKEKYEVLKTDSNDLNEEYSTLKLNYNILRDEYKTQRNSSENANQVFKTNLSEKDEQLDNKNAELNFQCKIFIDEIKKILKKTNDESVKLEDVNIEDDLSSLKRSLHLHICKLDSTVESLLGSIKDCKFAMKSIEEKLAGSSTENCMLKIENEEKQQKIVDLEKLFQRLSNEYKLRLDQYINDMKKYFNNDSLINDKHQIGLFIDSFKENYVKESQYKDDLLSRLEEKIKKLQCYQRQYIISYKLHMNDCTKKSSYLDEHVLHLSLPGEAQQEDFFMKENFDLQKRTREMQETIKVLESELENYKTMKFASSRYNVNNHSFEVNNSNQFNRQSYLEKERAGLLTRCLLAEERMKAQERRLEEVKMKWSMEVEQLYDQLNQYEVSAPRRYLPINENDNIQYEHFLPPIEPSPGTMPYK